MLGTGAIVKRPMVITDENGNESIGVRSMCYLPLTYDHRLMDGADAGRFLTTIKQRSRKPRSRRTWGSKLTCRSAARHLRRGGASVSPMECPRRVKEAARCE